MRLTIPAILPQLAACLALALHPVALASARTMSQAPQAIKELAPVEIGRKKNPGDLSYKSFFDIQTTLQSFLPPEPRIVDLRYRVYFTELDPTAADAYLPTSWAVAIVGDTVDYTVPITRGGYFTLPYLEQAAQEKATLMFNTQTRWRHMQVAWMVRLGEGQTLPYAGFAQALGEVKFVQAQIPWYRLGLLALRSGGYDGLRACFHSPGGRIEVDGRPAAVVTDGMCQGLKFDPAIAGKGTSRIAFIGDLDIVTINEIET